MIRMKNRGQAEPIEKDMSPKNKIWNEELGTHSRHFVYSGRIKS